MKLLIITNLFPNAKEPARAMYNKQQFAELSKLCELKIIAPVPYFKYSGKDLPDLEVIDGIEVYHPRYLVTPKVLRSLYGIFFFFGIMGSVRNVYRSFKFDAILGSWAYPDGFASALIAGIFKKSLFIKVHGSDINLVTRYFFRRKMIVYALKNAQKIIAVSAALKEKMIILGVPQNKIAHIQNGINTDLFLPLNKIKCREKLNLPVDKKIILYVGNLEKVKGIDVLIEAMKVLNEDIYLVIVGSGNLQQRLIGRVKELMLEDRIKFVGTKSHFEIPVWMNSADVFCLPSRNEGCPNVLLEALACGTYIIAMNVGGIPEIINSEKYGILTESGDCNLLSISIVKALKKAVMYKSKESPAFVKSWGNNAARLFDTLKDSSS